MNFLPITFEYCIKVFLHVQSNLNPLAIIHIIHTLEPGKVKTDDFIPDTKKSQTLIFNA